MKLSEFKTLLQNNLPKWEISIDDDSARLTLNDWNKENKIHSSDLDYIKSIFKLNHVTVVNKVNRWECNDVAIVSEINLKHDIKFEKKNGKNENNKVI